MREDGLTSVISPDQEISSGRVLSSRFSEVLLVQHKQEIARHRMYEMRMVRSHGFTSWAMFHGGSGAASVPIADALCQCSSVHANRSDRERVDPQAIISKCCDHFHAAGRSASPTGVVRCRLQVK